VGWSGIPVVDRRVQQQLLGEEAPVPVDDEILAQSAWQQLGISGAVLIHRPSHYSDVPDGTPLGAIRPALVWDDVILTVLDGNLNPGHQGRLNFQLARCCAQCGTLLIGRYPEPGWQYIDSPRELTDAVATGYQRHVDDCAACRTATIRLPVFGVSTDCHLRLRQHRFLAASVPGPWPIGDLTWCQACGKQRVVKGYATVFVSGYSTS